MLFIFQCVGLLMFIAGACGFESNIALAVLLMLIGGFITYGSFQIEQTTKK